MCFSWCVRHSPHVHRARAYNQRHSQKIMASENRAYIPYWVMYGDRWIISCEADRREVALMEMMIFLRFVSNMCCGYNQQSAIYTFVIFMLAPLTLAR